MGNDELRIANCRLRKRRDQRVAQFRYSQFAILSQIGHRIAVYCPKLRAGQTADAQSLSV